MSRQGGAHLANRCIHHPGESGYGLVVRVVLKLRDKPKRIRAYPERAHEFDLDGRRHGRRQLVQALGEKLHALRQQIAASNSLLHAFCDQDIDRVRWF